MDDANRANSVVLPIREQGSHLDELDQLAPGVKGYCVKHGGAVYVPWISADREGSGDVGRFLDALPSGTKIPNIISARLLGMLKRRGWTQTYEHPNGMDVDVWVKP